MSAFSNPRTAHRHGTIFPLVTIRCVCQFCVGRGLINKHQTIYSTVKERLAPTGPMLALTDNFRPVPLAYVKCFFIAIVHILEKSSDCRAMDISTLFGQFDMQFIKCYLAILGKTLLKPPCLAMSLALPGA
ncbi:MAG: hypothetical protein KTR23_04005 [Rhodospirillales bacterium]|nr:hypothetical protein [Rhodospirillales bacterium]